MLLYHSPTSPFVRKVNVLIAEAGLESQVRREVVAGTPISPGTMPVQQNPLGKVPALTLDDGRVIYDSRVICRYLDQRAKAGLYPEGEALWDVLVLEALADGMLDAAVLMVYEVRQRPEEIRLPAWIAAQWAKVARALDVLEREKIGLLAGPLHMGQVAVGAALGYLDFRHPGRNWRAGHPNLAAWEAGFAARPSMRATVPVQA
jgi:glutathione S-transferase